MHVAHFKAGTLARQTARTKSRDATLVGDLGQGVGLVHELRQLAGTEELPDCGADRLGVDQIVRHQIVRLRLRQAFLHGPFDAHQPGAKLILGQFAHRADAAIAQMIDVVDLTATIAQFDQQLDDFNDVTRRQRQLFAHFAEAPSAFNCSNRATAVSWVRFSATARGPWLNSASTCSTEATESPPASLISLTMPSRLDGTCLSITLYSMTALRPPGG
jgi:hypothetical protein